MKQILITAVAAMISCMTMQLNAQNIEVHAGPLFSIYDVLGVELPSEIRQIHPGVELGVKRIRPIVRGLDFYYGVDVQGRHVEFKNAVLSVVNGELIDGNKNSPLMVNIPLTVGLQGSLHMSADLSLFAGAGGGINWYFGHDKQWVDNTVTWAGDAHLEGESVWKFSEQREYTTNDKNLMLKFLYNHLPNCTMDPSGAPSLHFESDLGARWKNITLSLHYGNYGVVQMSRIMGAFHSKTLDGTMLNAVAFVSGAGETFVHSSLGLRLGYLF